MFRFESLGVGFESLKAIFQNWSGLSKNEEGDSNASREDSNPDSKEWKLKNQKAVIEIPIPVSLHEDQDSNPYLTDSNLGSRKGLNSCSIKKIWILIQRIRIQIPVRRA